MRTAALDSRIRTLPTLAAPGVKPKAPQAEPPGGGFRVGELPRRNGEPKDAASVGAWLGTALGRMGPGALAVIAGAACLTTAATPSVAHAEAQESAEERELREKLTRLVDRDFAGDIRAAFDHYAGADAAVNRSELGRLLERAGIGNLFTRGFWIDGIMERVDGPPNGNGNGKIDWSEFQRITGTP